MRKLSILFITLTFIGCNATKTQSSKKIQLEFLDEYILSDSLVVNRTVVGGLSGIDYHKGKYYLVCDDANPTLLYS